MTIKTSQYDYDKYGKLCQICEESMTITGQYKWNGAQSGEHTATETDYYCERCDQGAYSVEYVV